MKRQQKIYILTEGGGGKGWGHLIRCSALYQAFSERSFVPQMVVNGDDSCAILLSGMKYQIYNWLKDSQKLFDCLKDARGAVVDSYLAPKPFYERISQLVDGRIIMIDDLKRMEYPRGIVVNPSIYGDKLEYPKKKEVTYLLGRDYIIFRKPFWTVPKKYPREIVQHVFLSLGGTRQNGSLKRLLEILAVNLPFSTVHLVAPDYQPQPDIGLDINIYNHLSGTEIRHLMSKCDFCISAGGQTLYELIRMRVPVITVCLAKNQSMGLQTFVRLGVVMHAGWVHDKDLPSELAVLIQKILCFCERDKIVRRQTSVIDGNGVHRILDVFQYSNQNRKKDRVQK